MNHKPLWVLALCAVALGCGDEPQPLDTSALADSIVSFPGQEPVGEAGAATWRDAAVPLPDRIPRLGASCDSDVDCLDDQFCHFGGRLVVAHNQCATPCDSNEACQAEHGEDSICLGAGVDICVATCQQDSDCPSETFCNSAGWCSRDGTGIPACVGVAVACNERSGTPEDCRADVGCALTAGCTGTPRTCFMQSLEIQSTLDCGTVRGCVFDGSFACTGEPESCESQDNADDCVSQPQCAWSDLCEGEALPCEEQPLEACAQNLGCEVGSVVARR